MRDDRVLTPDESRIVAEADRIARGAWARLFAGRPDLPAPPGFAPGDLSDPPGQWTRAGAISCCRMAAIAISAVGAAPIGVPSAAWIAMACTPLTRTGRI